MVRITDVFPDGRSIGILEGGRRMRHRNGYRSSDEALPTPDSVYAIDIQLPDMAYTLPAGHRLRIVVTGHNWPQFDRNLQNGGAVLSPGDSLAGDLRIHSSPALPSWIELQVSDAYTGLQLPGSAESTAEPAPLLHPNPARLRVWAEAPPSPKTRRWTLLGMDGRSMATGTWPAGSAEIRISLEGLSPGPYRLALEGHATAALVVE
jgi:hypothetical protein